ncbi:hypothetical protein SUGI_0502990 [Cryptomeria japonica]|nr:hypothetical protein SUGI_0502990 [Cryptomeria japonica]
MFPLWVERTYPLKNQRTLPKSGSFGWSKSVRGYARPLSQGALEENKQSLTRFFGEQSSGLANRGERDPNPSFQNGYHGLWWEKPQSKHNLIPRIQARVVGPREIPSFGPQNEVVATGANRISVQNVKFSMDFQNRSGFSSKMKLHPQAWKGLESIVWDQESKRNLFKGHCRNERF